MLIDFFPPKQTCKHYGTAFGCFLVFGVKITSLLALAFMCLWDLLFVFFMINAYFLLLCVFVDMLLLIGSWFYLLVAGEYRVQGTG